MIDINLIDPSWVANILSISVTLIIFLLGIPALIIQTFVPENLREYYSKTISNNKNSRLLNHLVVIMLFMIIFFGNHAIRYVIDKFTTIDLPIKLGSTIIFLTKERVIETYYMCSLLFFLYLCYKVFVVFKENIFRTENIKERIIFHFFENLKTDFNDSGEISELNQRHLINLCNIYCSGVDRVHFFEQVDLFVLYVIENKNYNGNQLKFFFEQIYFNIIITDFSILRYREIDNVIDICQTLSERKFRSYDYDYVTNVFLFRLSVKLIEIGEKHLVDQTIATLKKLDAFQDTFFKIYFHAFENKMYGMVVIEINEIIRNLKHNKANTVFEKEELFAKKINLIAYLSFFYNGNGTMNTFSKNYLRNLIEKFKLLQYEDFEFSKTSFVRVAKFDTADRISIMSSDFFNLGS